MCPESELVHVKTLDNRAVRQEILDRIAQLSGADQGKWGRMSVHQMVCHLRDGYGAALGEKAVTPATSVLQRTVVKWAALWAPLQWMKGYPTRPEMEQGKGGSAPADFESDRKALRGALERFCEELPQPCLPHPVFGAMNAREWGRWGYLHADHHLRQFGR